MWRLSINSIKCSIYRNVSNLFNEIEGGINMPVWYKKYYDLLQKCKRISRCTTIHLWFEQTDARLRARLQDLEMHKKRTRLSAKRI